VTRAVLAALVLAAALAAAGCGAGAGDTPDEVRLTVTDDFGRERVLERTGPEVRGTDTVMRLLQRNAKVSTRYGGGFVQAIEGRSGGREGGRPVDWFYYVNGSLAEKGAASVRVRPGERIWWDRRDWGGAMSVDAVVGSFPEPFVSGLEGERLPTRIDCDDSAEAACDAVARKLADLGVNAARARSGTGGGAESIRVIVGLWPGVRTDRAAFDLERGPKVSGVFARVSSDGRTIAALDARGRAVRRLGPGTGLVAATKWNDETPTWIVTGTDAAGVAAAAKAFDERALKDRFALAVSGGRAIALPVEGGS
jgi:hypothetical protein